MKSSIKINNQVIDFKINRNRRAKHLRLILHMDGKLSVTIPWTASYKQGLQFVQNHIEWIGKNIQKIEEKEGLKKTPKNSREEYLKFKRNAKKFILENLLKLNQFYQLKYRRVSVKNQKTRWGSCSSDGNLNFNYKIALLPRKFARYVIVHELCHLKEMNHSKRFWDLVAQTIPDHKTIRREMKKWH